MSSRICVKNLTKNTVEKDLSGLFGTRGEITDVKIVRTPTGKSRQFGFIGFRTHEQAKDCQEYFNNTFLKSARISVEFAVRLGDPGLPTKHRKSAKTAETTQIDSKTDSKKDLTKLKKQAKVVVAPAAVTDSAKGEFMSVMKARGKGQFWTNDDINSAAIHGGPVPVVRGRKRSNSESSVGSDSDSSYDDEAGLTSAPAVALTAAVSDMSYLQSKRRQMTEDSSDSDEDSGDDAAVRESFPDQESVDAPVTAEEPAESAIEEETDESRLFIRNLPFSCSEEELTELFIKFGPLTQVHIPLADAGDGRGKGFAFVQFMIPEHASNARALLDGTSFQGRLLHIIKAKKAFEPITDAADMAAAAKARKMSSYQLKKEEERKKSAGIKEGWNASHIRSDTVIEATAEK